MLKPVTKIIGITFLALAVVGIWVDFVPNQKLQYVGYVLSLFLVAVYFLALKKARLYNWIPNANKYLQILLAFSFCYASCFISTVHGLAYLANEFLSNPATIEMKLAKQHSRSRRNCDYKLTGSGLSSAFPSHYCISEKAYNYLPKFGTYTVKVYESKLGITINHIDFESVEHR